jgi:large subunit ribosomal protein L3
MTGHFKKSDAALCRFLRELRLEAKEGIKAGDRVLAGEFQVSELVDVISKSKGRGFQGVVKRHGFAGGPESHGSMCHRAPGSIGSSSYPSRVFKGMRMGGRMGNARVTARNLEIVEVNADDNVILVKGAVPGPNGSYVIVRRTGK